MTATVRAGLNPYVGPRAFRPGERLYGRDHELLELLGLFLAERIVLIHSPSGAGKTSLIEAALVPRLEQEEFEVLPTIRVSLESPLGREPGDGRNRYVLSALISLEEGVPAGRQLAVADLAGLSLDQYLSRRSERLPGAENRVLIFDQFEEILVDPTDQVAKREFFSQLGAALRRRDRWALFAMREDYVAALDPYLGALPTRARTRFRLDFLSQEAAREAVQRPAEQAGVTFSDGAVSKLIDDLRQIWVQQPDGSSQPRPGPYVEPVQLQVVCLRLWDRLQPDQREVREEDIESAGDVGMALSTYYGQQVLNVSRHTGVSERSIRDWFDQQLIVERKFRGQTREGPKDDSDRGRSVVGLLQDAHLIRADQRRGTTWYELAHDRLIEPVQDNNAQWRHGHLHAMQRQAAIWGDEGRPDGLLLGGRELAEAEWWANKHPAELTKLEHEFLDRCRQARVRAGRKRLRARIFFGLAAAAVVLGLVAVYQARVAASRERMAAALAGLDTDPLASIDDALSALKTNPRGMTEEIRDNLYRSVETSRIRATLTDSGGPGGFSGIALNSDGTRLVGGTWTGQALVWDMTTRRELFRLPPEPYGVFGVALAGNRIATAGPDSTKIWNASTGELVKPLDPGGQVRALAFGPGGKRLATAGPGRLVTVWNAASGQYVHDLRAGSEVLGVALDRDGRLATAGADGMVEVWDTTSWRRTRRFRAHSHEIEEVAFNPSGTLLATASLDGTSKIWSVRTGRELTTLVGHANSVFWVGFAPEGDRVATASADGTARVWDVASGRLLLTLRGHTNPISGAAFGAQGATLVTASWDGTVKVWDATTAHADFVNSAVFSPNGGLVATASADKTAKLWKAASNRAMTCAGKDPGTPDAWSQVPPTLRGHTDAIAQVAFSPRGDLVATASADRTAKLWEVASGRLVRTLSGHRNRLNGVAFNDDGTRLATTSADGTARLWDVESGAVVHTLEGHLDQVFGVAFDADGTRLATTSQDGTVKLWDAESGQEMTTLTGHTNVVIQVAFSPKRGSNLLATASLDRTVLLWDLQSGQSRRLGPERANAVADVAFSPDGDRLATASWDRTVQVWDVASEERRLTISHSTGVGDVAFSPNGKLLAAATLDGEFHVYDLDDDNLLALAQCRAAAG